jgi:hypothetical protein
MDKNYLRSISKKNKNPLFPESLIDEECLQYRDLLFDDSKDNNNTNNYSNKSEINDMSSSFIKEFTENKKVEKVIEKTSTTNYNKPKPTPTQNTANKWRQNTQTPTEEKTNPNNDTVDFLKGNNNKNEVEEFVRGSKWKKEDNQNNLNNDTMNETNQNTSNILNNISESSENLNNTNNLYNNEYFKNFNQQGQNQNKQIHPMPFPFPYPPQMIPMNINMNPPQNFYPIPQQTQQNKTFEKVKIENLLIFNKLKNIPNDQPFWYLSAPWPTIMSSSQLTDMYNAQMIDGNVFFRPLDIFHFRNVNQNKNEFAKLKIINEDSWVNDIQDSPLLQFTELYATSKKLLDVKKNVNSGQNSQKNEKFENVKKTTLPVNEETLQLTTTEIKKEVRHFLHDTNDDDSEEDQSYKKNRHDITNVMNIGKEIEQQDENWEKVDKKKKKAKDQDPSFYLIGTKKTKPDVKEKKATFKVDIVPAEELLKDLDPKKKTNQIYEDEKPNYDAFNLSNGPSGNNNEWTNGKGKKQKLKGKPQELNVKLGFK